MIAAPPQSKPRKTPTHVLVPAPVRDALNDFCTRFRQRQCAVVAEALSRLSEKHAKTETPTEGPIMPAGPLVSIVPRLPAECLDFVQRLSARTRVSQSDYMREAIVDLLEQEDAAPWLRPEASLDEPTTLRLVEGG